MVKSSCAYTLCVDFILLYHYQIALEECIRSSQCDCGGDELYDHYTKLCKDKSEGLSGGIIAAIVVPILVIIIIMVLVAIGLTYLKHHHSKTNSPEESENLFNDEL